MTYAKALRALNDAAYAACRLAPEADRATLRTMARTTDDLVDNLPPRSGWPIQREAAE